MKDFSILIGGKAGFGIDRAGVIIANILSRMDYRIYIYRDYPSIIRGGHTFSVIRASDRKIACHKKRADILLALNQDTFDLHKDRLADSALIIYDSDSVKIENIPAASRAATIPIAKILKEENAPEIMRNSCIIGALCKAEDIPWDILDKEFREDFSKDPDLNLKIARRGYDAAAKIYRIEPLGQERLPLFSGNEATGLGLSKGGIHTSPIR